jgi:hypothetical protein
LRLKVGAAPARRNVNSVNTTEVGTALPIPADPGAPPKVQSPRVVKHHSREVSFLSVELRVSIKGEPREVELAGN